MMLFTSQGFDSLYISPLDHLALVFFFNDSCLSWQLPKYVMSINQITQE